MFDFIGDHCVSFGITILYCVLLWYCDTDNIVRVLGNTIIIVRQVSMA